MTQEEPKENKAFDSIEQLSKIAQDLVRRKTELSQTEQEPVAYLCENAVGHKYFRWKKPPSTYKPIALYTTPPQRTWQGLTDEDVERIVREARVGEHGIGYTIAQAIEAKLKERNT